MGDRAGCVKGSCPKRLQICPPERSTFERKQTRQHTLCCAWSRGPAVNSDGCGSQENNQRQHADQQGTEERAVPAFSECCSCGRYEQGFGLELCAGSAHSWLIRVIAVHLAIPVECYAKSHRPGLAPTARLLISQHARHRRSASQGGIKSPC